MAGIPRKLTVSYTADALASLDEIWSWNAHRYHRDHASSYIAFLEAETNKLGVEHACGKPVPSRSGIRYVTIRRKNRGHGHVAVFEIVGDIVYILDYFHTSQNWQRKLAEKERK